MQPCRFWCGIIKCCIMYGAWVSRNLGYGLDHRVGLLVIVIYYLRLAFCHTVILYSYMSCALIHNGWTVLANTLNSFRIMSFPTHLNKKMDFQLQYCYLFSHFCTLILIFHISWPLEQWCCSLKLPVQNKEMPFSFMRSPLIGQFLCMLLYQVKM